MRDRSFPVRSVGVLTGVLLWLTVGTVSAQPPDPAPPSVGGAGGTAANSGVARESWARAIEHRSSRPGLRHRGPMARPSCLSWPPCRRALIRIRSRNSRAGRYGRRSRSNRATEVPTIGTFQAVDAPRIERDEDAFPGLDLEIHTGKVKWVAQVQLATGVKPEAVKIDGKVNVQLCDAEGCAQPKDYPFTAGLRPDVAAVQVALPNKSVRTSVPARPDASPPVSPPPSISKSSAPAGTARRHQPPVQRQQPSRQRPRQASN